MKNFKQEGDVLTLTAPAGGVVSGLPYLIGGLVVIASATVAETLPFEGRALGVFELPKTAAQAWAEGDPVYFDPITAKFDNTGAIGVLAGVATAVAANPTAVGNVRLIGIVSEPNTPVVQTATVAAAGTIQGDAAALAPGFSLVTAADATKGVQLPTAAPGKQVLIKNGAAAVLKVWPFLGDGINAVAVNGSFAMAANTSALFTAYDATTWYTNPLVAS